MLNLISSILTAILAVGDPVVNPIPQLEWMYFTWPTLILEILIFTMYGTLFILDRRHRSQPRKGFWILPTTRGDRVFWSLLFTFAIGIFWLVFLTPVLPDWGMYLALIPAAIVAYVMLRWG